MMAQIRDLQNKVNSLSDAREFYDPSGGDVVSASLRTYQRRVGGEELRWTASRMMTAMRPLDGDSQEEEGGEVN